MKMKTEDTQEKKAGMEPTFNFFGQTVCWLEGKVAFSNDGWPVAFIKNGAVFAAKNGHYLGEFSDGVFRDRVGSIVAFRRNVWWCRVRVTPKSAKIPPTVQSRMVPGRAHLPASSPPAFPLLNRSRLDWKRFARGVVAKYPCKTRL